MPLPSRKLTWSAVKTKSIPESATPPSKPRCSSGAISHSPHGTLTPTATTSLPGHSVAVSVSRPRRIRPAVSIVLGATMACWAATAVSRKQRWIGLVR